jgi:hypothetical protein
MVSIFASCHSSDFDILAHVRHFDVSPGRGELEVGHDRDPNIDPSTGYRRPHHRSMVESVRSSAPEKRRQRLADYRAMA